MFKFQMLSYYVHDFKPHVFFLCVPVLGKAIVQLNCMLTLFFMDCLLIFCFGSFELEHFVFLIFLLFALQHISWNILLSFLF